jgi:site-specific recombinase XerD
LLHGPRYQDEQLVFADEIGRPLNPYAVSKRFKTLALAAGLRPDARLYSLRHSSATHSLQDGMDIKSVAAKLGLSTPVVTLTTYAHAAGLDRQRESTERLAARSRAVTPAPPSASA